MAAEQEPKELSMAEILASIRKILEENGVEEARRHQDDDDEVLELTSSMIVAEASPAKKEENFAAKTEIIPDFESELSRFASRRRHLSRNRIRNIGPAAASSSRSPAAARRNRGRSIGPNRRILIPKPRDRPVEPGGRSIGPSRRILIRRPRDRRAGTASGFTGCFRKRLSAVLPVCLNKTIFAGRPNSRF